jgi:Zn-dependent peptidase ImmA (M78 family)
MIIDMRDLRKGRDGDFMCKPLERLCGKSAEYILDTYGNKYSYPVDIVQIVRNIGGISLGSKDFTELDKLISKDNENAHIIGAVRVLENGLQIIYADRLDKEKDSLYPDMTPRQRNEKLIRRQRFTIAHELAHCCLHIDATQKKNYIELRSENVDIGDAYKEKVANIFAGELLMPRLILDAFILNPKKYGVNMGEEVSVKKMADAFLVNNHTMLARLKHLRESDNLYNNIQFNTDGICDAGEVAL